MHTRFLRTANLRFSRSFTDIVGRGLAASPKFLLDIHNDDVHKSHLLFRNEIEQKLTHQNGYRPQDKTIIELEAESVARL